MPLDDISETENDESDKIQTDIAQMFLVENDDGDEFLSKPKKILKSASSLFE